MSSKLGPAEPPGIDRRLSESDFNEVDFDYDSVNSPGASSTSSEPVYIRQPGFDHHAHEFKAGSTGVPIAYKKEGINPYSLVTCGTPVQAKESTPPTPFNDEPQFPSGASCFPSPPHTPASLYSVITHPTKFSDQKLWPECQELEGKPVCQPLAPCPIPTSPVSSTDGQRTDSDKARTGNHTPPGYASGSRGTKKKKPNTSDQSREGTPETIRPHGKYKIKREPLPMKLRALPESFWLQPNKNNNMPPSCSALPPLIIGKDVSEVIDISPVSPPRGEKEHGKSEREEKGAERMIKVGNTDLLLRLFDSVEKDDKKKVQVVRRGRPRKPCLSIPMKSIRDEDPCLVSTATESILPLLPDRTPASSGSSTPSGIRHAQGQQILELVNLREGDRTVSLPSLNIDHGYSQLLSELVLRL